MKSLTLIGDTCTGLNGKNIRSALKGHHKAQPRPPLVIMSSKGWVIALRAYHIINEEVF